MTLIWNEVVRSFFKHKGYWFLMFLVLTLSAAVAFLIMVDLNSIGVKKSNFMVNQLSDYDAFVIDVLPAQQSDADRYFASDDGITNLRRFFDEIRGNPDYTAYNMSPHAIPVIDSGWKFPRSFTYGFDVGMSTGDLYSCGLQAVNVTPNVYGLFGLTLMEGRMASEESGTYEKGVPVEVVMGYEYADWLRIGDTLRVSWQTEPMTLVVVGFLDHGMMAPSIWGGMMVLDKTILMPSFDDALSCSSFGGDPKTFVRSTSIGTPFLLANRPGINPAEWIRNLSVRICSYAMRCTTIAGTEMVALTSSSNQNLVLTWVLVGVVLSVVVLSVSILVGIKFRNNRLTYAIYLTTGSGPGRILAICLIENALLVLPAILCAYLLLDAGSYYGMPVILTVRRMLALAAGVFSLTTIPVLVNLVRLRPAEHIRGRHT